MNVMISLARARPQLRVFPFLHLDIIHIKQSSNAMAHLDGGDSSRCVTFLIESSLETMPHTTGAQDTKPCTCKRRMREAGTEKKRAAKSDEISGARQWSYSSFHRDHDRPGSWRCPSWWNGWRFQKNDPEIQYEKSMCEAPMERRIWRTMSPKDNVEVGTSGWQHGIRSWVIAISTTKYATHNVVTIVMLRRRSRSG